MKLFIFLAILALLLPQASIAAQPSGVLYLNAPQSAAVGQNATVVIMADPKGQMADTVRAVIKFSNDILEVKSVTLSSTFSVADPDSFYSNAEGVVSYAGGIPGGTAQPTAFATITFAAKKAGAATISFDGQSIMLSGGASILAGLGKAVTFDITEGAVSPESTKSQETITKQAPSPVPTGHLSKGDKPQISNTATAALESVAVPIVATASSGIWNYILAHIWFILFWLLAAADIAYLLRGKIQTAWLRYGFLTFIAAGLLLGAQATKAQSGADVAVHPSKETIIIASGKVVKKSLLVVNSSSKPLAFKVSVFDVAATNKAGGIRFYESTDEYDAKKWLVPQYEVITVQALSSAKIEYIVSTSSEMPGKGYLGAIVLQLYDAKTKKTVGEPFGTLVMLNVLKQGITTGGSISSFTHPMVQFIDPVKMGFTVQNPSNSNLSLAGDVVVTNIFGKGVGRFKTGQLDVYPGTARTFKFQWSEAPIFGGYIVKVTLVDALRKDNIVTAWTPLVFLPWLIMLGIVLAIGILTGGYYWYVRKTYPAIPLKTVLRSHCSRLLVHITLPKLQK